MRYNQLTSPATRSPYSPVVYGKKSGTRSICLVSYYLHHDKYVVHVFLLKLFGMIKAENPGLQTITVLADGSAAQF